MPLTVLPARPVTDSWRVCSHSWFMNQTGPSGDQTGRVDALFRSAMDIEFNNWRNYAVAGARISSPNRHIGGWARVVNNIIPPAGRGAPYAPDGGGTVLCYGINDLGIYGGQLTNVRATIADAHRAVISRCRASAILENDAAAFAYGAGWTSSASGPDLASGANPIGGTASTRTCSTTTAATITFTIPADYKGETLAFFFLKRPDTSGGTVTFSGTAGVTGTFYTANGLPSAFLEHAYTVKRVTNLTAANAGQTIIMTTTQVDASGALFFDCVGLESLTPPPVLVVNIAKLTAAGYGNALYTAWTGTESSKDGDVDTTNGLIAAVVAEFDGMVQIANADAAIAKDATKTSDGIHPNESGAGPIVDELVRARNRLTPPGTAFGETLSFNPPSPRTAAQRRPRIVGYYHAPDFVAYSTYTPVAGHMFALPYQITESREVYSTMSVEVSTAGSTASTIRLGVYDDVSWSGYPQQLFSGGEATSGGALSVAASLGAKTQTWTFPWVADPGLYWLVVKVETVGTSQVLRGLTGQSPFLPVRPVAGTGTVLNTGWQLTGQATGALAGSFPTGAALAATVPLVQVLKSK
jgi:hypothetical protein